MLKKHDKLDGIQYIALISSTIMGVIVISLPNIAIESAHEGALLSTIMASILATIFAVSMNILGNRFPKKTIIEYLVSLMGKPLGKSLGFILIIYFTSTTAVILRVFSDALKGLLLHNTPLEVIMISMLLTVVYLCLNGINGITKLSELFLPIIILSLLLVIGLSASNFNFVRLRPVLLPSLWQSIKAIPNLASVFLGYEIILVVTPFVARNKSTIPNTLIGIGIPSVLYILLVIMAIGVLVETNPTDELSHHYVGQKNKFSRCICGKIRYLLCNALDSAAFISVANFFYISSLSIVRLFTLRNYQPFVIFGTNCIYVQSSHKTFRR